MPESVANLVPFESFETASRAVLSLLHQRLGFDLWMMTRTDGQDWIVLQVEDHGYKVQEGAVFRWADSFCSQMVLGLGPRVAPCAQEIPTYAAAPIGRQVAIGAYIGVPIQNADGSLFGTLCAIDPAPQNDSIERELPWIELLSRLLGTILVNELKATAIARESEQSHQLRLTDALTGLLSQQGWDEAIATEEARARRYGSPTCILMFELNGLTEPELPGERTEDISLIKNASASIRKASRQSDSVAYLGNGRFAVLASECDSNGADALKQNIVKAISQINISARVGKAMRNPSLGLLEAVSEANRQLQAARST